MDGSLAYDVYGQNAPSTLMKIAASPPVAFLAYTLTHPYMTFILVGYGKLKGVSFASLIPLLAHFIQVFASMAVVWIHLNKSSHSLITKKALTFGMPAKHIVFLGFVYGFGYFGPTIVLIQT